MTEGNDDKTLPLGPAEEFPIPASAGGDTRPMAAVMEAAKEDLHLAADHGLVAVKAYVKDEKRAKQRTASAERQEKFLEKKKAEGLVKTFVPATVAQAVKEAGGDFSAWLEQQRVTPPASPAPTPTRVPEAVAPVERVVEKVVEVPVEKIVQVPAKLSEEDAKALRIGKRVQDLTGWRKAILSWLL